MKTPRSKKMREKERMREKSTVPIVFTNSSTQLKQTSTMEGREKAMLQTQQLADFQKTREPFSREYPPRLQLADPTWYYSLSRPGLFRPMDSLIDCGFPFVAWPSKATAAANFETSESPILATLPSNCMHVVRMLLLPFKKKKRMLLFRFLNICIFTDFNK